MFCKKDLGRSRPRHCRSQISQYASPTNGILHLHENSNIATATAIINAGDTSANVLMSSTETASWSRPSAMDSRPSREAVSVVPVS